MHFFENGCVCVWGLSLICLRKFYSTWLVVGYLISFYYLFGSISIIFANFFYFSLGFFPWLALTCFSILVLALSFSFSFIFLFSWILKKFSSIFSWFSNLLLSSYFFQLDYKDNLFVLGFLIQVYFFFYVAFVLFCLLTFNFVSR